MGKATNGNRKTAAEKMMTMMNKSDRQSDIKYQTSFLRHNDSNRTTYQVHDRDSDNPPIIHRSRNERTYFHEMTEIIQQRANQQIQQHKGRPTRRRRSRRHRIKVVLLLVVVITAVVVAIVSIVLLDVTVPSTIAISAATATATIRVNAMIQGGLGKRSVALSSSGKIFGSRSSARNSQKGVGRYVSQWPSKTGSSQLHSQLNQPFTRNRTSRYISTKPLSDDITGSSNGSNNSKRFASSSLLDFPESIPLRKWIDLSVPEGRVVGVAPSWKYANRVHFDEYILEPSDPDAVTDANLSKIDNHWIRRVFHPDEVEFGMTLKKTRTSFWLGRLALRCLLLNENDSSICKYNQYSDYPPILRDPFGRPDLSSSSTDSSMLFGSISHKKDRGVAILANPYIQQKLSTRQNSNEEEEGRPQKLVGVGIDLELVSRPGKASIAKRVLTAKELKELGRLTGITSEEEVLLRFSLKEAIYKAIHPLLCQYVSFQEAEVTPYNDGTASCTWMLQDEKCQRSIDEKVSKLTAHWIRIGHENYDNDSDDTTVDGFDQYFLTSASVFSDE